ncbi:MAG: ATP-binding cassette domain-containing protein [Deltaproteobacteria bacterium]|nr:ATP-binding cassette domain-containing protein [Deltaproteobacteria bacterium]
MSGDTPETAETASPPAKSGGSGPATAQVPGIRLELQGIVQDFPGPDGGPPTRVVDGIDLTFDRPGINMLLGPSGCGKSTVLRMMGGVRTMGVKSPTSGKILIDGVECTGAHDDAIMVFQRYANRPDLSVRENVAFPFRLSLWKKKVPHDESQRRVDEILERVGLADKAKLLPAQLSGGQNQRVALARALVLRPRILLMDEPFGALDAQTREEMQRLLVDLYDLQPCLVVFVTHDVSESLLLGDRVIVLSTQPARIADDFTIFERRPRSPEWQRSTEGVTLENRILSKLHAAGTRGQIRISV